MMCTLQAEQRPSFTNWFAFKTVTDRLVCVYPKLFPSNLPSQLEISPQAKLTIEPFSRHYFSTEKLQLGI